MIVKAETAFVLYKDEMKYNRLPEALQHWRILHQLAPGSNGKVKYHFDDGVSFSNLCLIKQRIQNWRNCMWTLLWWSTTNARECFGDEAYVNGSERIRLLYYYPDYTSEAHIYDLLKSNFDVKSRCRLLRHQSIHPLLYNGVINGSVSFGRGRKYALLIDKAIIKKGVAAKVKRVNFCYTRLCTLTDWKH